MAEGIYATPPALSYALGTLFYRPTDAGDTWAVSFSSEDGTLLTAAMSVAVTIVFLCFWNLVSVIGVSIGIFCGQPKLCRYAAVVTLWNSNDSWFAFKELGGYVYHCLLQPGRRSTADILFGLAFCISGLVVFGASIALSIEVPAILQVGNVAPVRPLALAYPRLPMDEGTSLRVQNQGIRIGPTTRSLGSVQQAETYLGEKVTVEDNVYPLAGGDGENIVEVKYNYQLTGVGMGLQGGSHLVLEVEGLCRTEYTWRVEPEGLDNTSVDRYYLWNDTKQRIAVSLNDSDTIDGPYASFSYHPDGRKQFLKDANVSFAIVCHSAHRTCVDAGSDPWYVTEPRDEPASDYQFNATLWVKRHRPVLSCWEQDRFSYKGQRVASVQNLKDLPDMEIPPVLLEVLENAFDGPMISTLGELVGESALESRATSYYGIINAEASSIKRDIGRLAKASYVSTVNIFTETTLFTLPDGYPDVLIGPDGQPQDGVGNFVVIVPDIQTFSFDGLIALAVVLVVLLLLNLLSKRVIHFCQNRGAEKWNQFTMLEAVQLFRSVYDQGKDAQDVEWGCGEPTPRSSVAGVVGSKCEIPGCIGHIEKSKCKRCQAHLVPKCANENCRSNNNNSATTNNNDGDD